MANPDNYQETLDAAIDKAKEEIQDLSKINIIIAGKSGAGKSTLINAAFGEELTKTGGGAPVTDKISLIENKDFPIRIYDTVGFELKQINQWKTKHSILQILRRTNKTETPDDDIHCLWYCVSATGTSLEDEELNFMKLFLDRNIPVILVLTQAYSLKSANEQKQYAQQKLPQLHSVSILANDSENTTAFGVDQLIELTATLLPDGLQNSFASAQKASLRNKRQAATKLINSAIVANFGTGFVPIPVADAPIMMSIQSTMLVKITTVYGINFQKNKVETALAGALGVFTAISAGKSVATSLIKLIPGGWVIGGTISGTVGAIITGALGYAYIELMEMVAQGKINLSEVAPEELTNLLISLIKQKMPQNLTDLDNINKN
ncbi:YcjF family protein [Lapidilactobacillus gannanensis]|uniref:YcjF family protein n=1 Tax=Lapidilactobacillus gannanensis TaxID=2486002 RepID=A0ABW4BJS5_9LACO|nr:DUF697 domain-containing protein [Lapidilactobacillus gannanensis]